MSKWLSQLKDNSVRVAVTKALGDGGSSTITDRTVEKIIKASLDAHEVSAHELHDLRLIANNARWHDSHAQRKFSAFYSTVLRTAPMTRGAGCKTGEIARERVFRFMSGRSYGTFSNLDRWTVGSNLLLHIRKPGILNQGSTSLCGPTAILYSIARDNPYAYVSLAIDLFERGRGRLGHLLIKPGSDLKRYRPPMTAQIDQAHWLLAASIRDSENWWFDYDGAGKTFAGLTRTGEIEEWLKKIGYAKVQSPRVASSIGRINMMFNDSWRIILLIDADLLYESEQDRSFSLPNHWVVLTSRISVTDGRHVSFKVFTWGRGQQRVPVGRRKLSIPDFFNKVFDCLAAKY